MPIRRFRKRVGYRKKRRVPWYKKRYSVMNLAHKAYKGVKYIKSLINVEKKYWDVARAFSAQSSTPTIANLSNLAVGDSYNNRDGNSILCQTLFIRLFIKGQAGTGPTGNLFRFIVFIDNDQRGTDPTAAELLEDTSTASNMIMSPLLHTVYKRFNVLIDKVCHIGAVSNVATQSYATGTMFKTFKFYKRLKGHHIRYSADAGADASNSEGSLYILTVSDDAVGPTLAWNSRLRFTDN